MSDMKCPFCQQKLNQDDPQIIECRNDDCKKSYFMYGSKELWQELIRTRKALDVAVDALKGIKNGREPICLGTGMDINDALEQITALTKGGNNE